MDDPQRVDVLDRLTQLPRPARRHGLIKGAHPHHTIKQLASMRKLKQHDKPFAFLPVPKVTDHPRVVQYRPHMRLLTHTLPCPTRQAGCVDQLRRPPHSWNARHTGDFMNRREASYPELRPYLVRDCVHRDPAWPRGQNHLDMK